jgi:glucokinase
MTLLAGVDIGGTTCSVSLGDADGGNVALVEKTEFPTPESPAATLERLTEGLADLIETVGERPAAAGISCGGPLDSGEGVIHSPPNLPDWDGIDVVEPFEDRFGVPTALQNDANAGALAEWQWGAGRGHDNVVFLTFGTGMGAGLIVDGSLYVGENDMAGEIGHVRLEDDGPVGYRKAGSFEGFCSGSGIAQLARERTEEALDAGRTPAFCPTRDELPDITARTVGEAAQDGDELAREIFREVGEHLGRGLAVLVDVLNPSRIVIGSIYLRQQSFLEPAAQRILREEAIERSCEVCEVVPAGLGEQVGEFASLAVAMNELHDR